MFEVISADQDQIDRALPNKPLSSYTIHEKQALLERYDALRDGGKDENAALAEIDVSKDIIERWRLECVTESEVSIQTKVESADEEVAEVVELIPPSHDGARLLPLRPASSYSRDERNAILDRVDELIRDGKSMSAALSEVGVSVNSIRKWRAELSVKANLRLVSIDKPDHESPELPTAEKTSKVQGELPIIETPQPPKPKGKRKILRNVIRQYSFEEKQGLIDRFAELVQSGSGEEAALTKLGLTYNTMYQWREELEARRKLAAQLPATKKRHKTQEEKERITSRYQTLVQAGMKGKDAADMFEVSHATILKWLQHPRSSAEEQTQPDQSEESWTPKTERQKKEHDEIKSKLAEYHSLRSDGKTAHQAAEIIGVTYRNVRRWINSGRYPGLEGKTHRFYSTEEKREYLAKFDQLIREGYRQDVAVKKSGIQIHNLHSWRKQFATNEEKSQTAKIEPNTNARNRAQRRSRRTFSKEQKLAIVTEFNALIAEGIRRDHAIEKLDIPNASIDRWRKQFATAPNEDKPHGDDEQQQVETGVTSSVVQNGSTGHSATEINIITEEKSMAKTSKKAKVRKAKTTKVVKQKKKDEPDLKAKVKPGPTLPTKGPKAKPKATKPKVEKPKAKKTGAKTAKAKATKAKKKGKRYSAQEKKDILARYNALRDSGTNAYDAAEKVGISYITIRSWEKKEGLGRRRKGPGGTKPVQTRSASTGGLSMVLPNGKRIEGLTLEQVIKIANNT